MKRETPVEIAIINMGTPDSMLRRKYGAYSDWFINAFRAADKRLDPDAFDVNEVDSEDLADYNGVVISGAEESANDDHPWRKDFDPVIRKYMESGRPVLGVCFGSQYLSRILGGKVVQIDGNGEFGNCEVKLTGEGKDDPLFAGIPNPAAFLQCHYDKVVEPAPGSTILAVNEKSPVQAFRWGESIRGVQFHPEATTGITMTIIDKLEIDEEEKDQLKMETQNPHDGLLVLRNFAEICVNSKVT